MKKLMILPLIGCFLSFGIWAQDTARLSNKPPAHIQVSNEMYQNHSQFYNKDNFFDNSRIYTTGNGTYWAPGYSNDANRSYNTNGLAPNTSVNVVNEYIRQSIRTTTGREIIPTNVIR